MDFQNQKKYNVIFKDRKAVLTGYNDQICLLFDKKDGVLDLGDIKVLDNYPEGSYCVFFSSLSMEERKQITLDNGDPLFKDCECSLIFDDKPNSDLLKDYIEITDDTIEYYVPDLLFDPSKYATVKCKNCGKKYKVNRKMGYRSSFFEWNVIAPENNAYDFSLIKNIIPAQLHDKVKQLIEDYSSLSDEDMWYKYNLEECWLSLEEYEDEKEEIDLIGFLIVNLLVENDFIAG